MSRGFVKEDDQEEIPMVAKALISKKVGEEAVLKLAKEDRVFEILDIAY